MWKYVTLNLTCRIRSQGGFHLLPCQFH